MDLLESLNLPSLPEQQTRISEHSALAEALEANPLMEVGFNACCCCGKALMAKPKKSGSIIECKGCQRVNYCSTKCRTLDSTPMEEQDEGGEDGYLPIQHGHSSIVCALLRLCNEDEAVDDKLFGEGPGGSALLRVNDDNDASMDRVRSELESYPATLANVILEEPCYERALLSSSKQLVIHVVGASQEAELWSNVANVSSAAQEAYAEALEAVTERNKRLERIHLIFVGPDCPKQNMHQSRMLTSVGGSTKEKIIDNNDDDDDHRKPPKRNIKDATRNNSRPATSKKLPSCELIIETIAAEYNGDLLKKGKKGKHADHVPSLPAPDVVVFFNPGFTCPDYTWDDALSVILPGTAFLVTTNTEMEGIADCQYLKERGFIASLPPSVAAIDDNDDDDDEEGTSSNLSFFGENPYSGSRVRQSGNMANDLFVKNRWIFGGIIEPPAKSKPRPSKVVVVSSATQKRSTTEKDEMDGQERKKKKRKGAGNTKKANPALI
eukprot:scaffold8420_cov48-Attheya_sp.AAC.2